MLNSSEQSSSNIEQRILRKVFVLLAVFTVFVAASGIGIGFLISGRRAQAGDNNASNLKTPEAMSSSFAEVARQVEPAVVNIDTKGNLPEISLKGEKPPNGTPDEILEYFKRQMPRRRSSAVGSGFIVDKAGYILTNFHAHHRASAKRRRICGESHR